MNQQSKNLISLLVLSFFVLIGSALIYKKSTIKSRKIYVFDIKYSPFIKLEGNVSYTAKKILKTTKNSEIIFGKIAKPVFIIKKNSEKISDIYLSAKCENIENVKLEKYQDLIVLKCNTFEMIPEIYESAKHLNLVSISLIDNRRWQISISKNRKIITIDFPAETPNIKHFEELDQKYNLTDKYTYIDLRFADRIRSD